MDFAMTLSISDLLAIVVAATAIVGVFYLASQTTAARRSVEIQTYVTLRSTLQEINNILLTRSDLAARLGFSEDDLLGFMILNYCEQIFLLHSRNIIDARIWEPQRVLIEKLIDRNIVRELWTEHCDEFDPEFVRSIESTWVDKAAPARAE